jgi:Ca2+-transporting ATPase
MQHWHTLKIEDLTHELGLDQETGLPVEEAARRPEQYGPNELVERGVKSPWKILQEQLTGIMVVILIISAVASLALEEYTDAVTILIIVVLNAALGFTQEHLIHPPQPFGVFMPGGIFRAGIGPRHRSP